MTSASNINYDIKLDGIFSSRFKDAVGQDIYPGDILVYSNKRYSSTCVSVAIVTNTSGSSVIVRPYMTSRYGGSRLAQKDVALQRLDKAVRVEWDKIDPRYREIFNGFRRLITRD